MLAGKSTSEKPCFCFEVKILHFYIGHTKWSTVLAAVEHSGPYPPLSACTSWYTSNAGTIPSFTKCLPVGRIFSLHDNLFYLFRYSLISIHSVEKNSTITAVVVITNTLWLNAPMFNTYDVEQMWHWWGPLQTTLCFPVTTQPDCLMCIPLGQMKTLLNYYTSFRLICNSAIWSGMWDDM